MAIFVLDLSELLQLMAKQYNDLDVRDRAGFYHQLMLTVSGDKVSGKDGINMFIILVLY